MGTERTKIKWEGNGEGGNKMKEKGNREGKNKSRRGRKLQSG